MGAEPAPAQAAAQLWPCSGSDIALLQGNAWDPRGMFVFQGGYLGAVFMSMLVFPGITPVCWVLHGALPREMLVFSKDVLVCAQESSYAPLRCLGASGDAFLLHKGSWLPQEHSGCSPGFLAAQSRCSLGAQVDAWLLQEDTWVTFV